MTRQKSRAKKGAAQAAAGVSWLALVAATTLGVSSLHRVRAAVSADTRGLAQSREGYRLIVQSYAPQSLSTAGVPATHARPLGSTQIAVTREQLERGIAVDVVGLDASASEEPVVVAWVESGRPNLEFDALEARPGQGAFIGRAEVSSDGRAGATRVVLTRREA